MKEARIQKVGNGARGENSGIAAAGDGAEGEKFPREQEKADDRWQEKPRKQQEDHGQHGGQRARW